MFVCNHCNYKTKYKQNLNVHFKTKRHISNSNKNNIDTIKLLNEKDIIINNLTIEINELKKNNTKLNEELHRVKDRQLITLQNTLKPCPNNNTQIIINNYPNAPNVSFPDTIKVDESLKEYIQLGGVKGLGKFISDHWGKNIDPKERSIWMVDSARNKFLLRYENAWVIDIDGKQFQEINLEKIQNLFNDYLNKYKFDTYDYIKTMEFILDIKTKNMIVKGLKDAGKFLVYDKEKFTDFEKIEGLL